MKTIFVQIGNSDDKLTQREWAGLYADVDQAIRFGFGTRLGKPTIHGTWVSRTADPWQNACWCIEVNEALEERLRRVLSMIAGEYNQDSIAWAEATTEFITPAEVLRG